VWRPDAVVRQVFKARQAQFGKRRHLGQQGLSLGADHGHHAQLAGFVVFNEVGHGAHPGRDLVAQHVTDHGGAAAVGGRLQVQLVFVADHLDQELGHRSRRRHAHRVLAFGFDPGHVFVE